MLPGRFPVNSVADSDLYLRAFAGIGPPVAGKRGPRSQGTRILGADARKREEDLMTQSVAAGILGTIALVSAAAAAMVIWFVLREPIMVADAIARLL
jgi:hypothetical protein